MQEVHDWNPMAAYHSRLWQNVMWQSREALSYDGIVEGNGEKSNWLFLELVTPVNVIQVHHDSH